MDRILSASGSYTPNAALTDDYHCFVLDPALASDQTLVGFNIVPGVAAEVHHVLVYAGIEALLPGGQSSCLIDIPAWNFRWQQIYFYDSPNGISLPAGTQVTYSCTWDNPGSTSVSWGEDTTDEMCIAYFYITS